MFHHIHLALVAMTAPLTFTYVVCSVSCLALLRAVGLRPRPIRAGDLEIDLSGKVVIVTGANTGESCWGTVYIVHMG